MSASNPAILKLLEQDIIESDVFREAITHRSAGKANNERLEFLGDSVLNLVITKYLFTHLPNASEGELSRLRAHLVRGETLAELAAHYDLGHALKLGAGELKSGGFRRESIMEDAFEAVIGAVYTLKGFDYVGTLILQIFAQKLNNLPHADDLKDPKSRLQEWLQSRGEGVPEYRLLETRGEAHKQLFVSECRVASRHLEAHDEGSSRRKAEQGAASKILQQLQENTKKKK